MIKPPFLPTIVLAALLGTLARAQEPVIEIHADHVIGSVSPYLTGACIEDVNHEIYGGIYSQMIFGESFQEPAALPMVKDFKVYDGRWLVHDGVVHIQGSDGPKLVSDREPFKDGAAGVEMMFADRDGGLGTLIVRLDKPGVGADKFTGYEISLDAAHQVLSLARHRNNYEPIDEVHYEVSTGRWIRLEARLNGPIIEIWVDGQMVLRHHDGRDALPAGAVALRAWRGDVSFRGLWVKTGARAQPLPLVQQAIPRDISRMWGEVLRGGAVGQYALSSDNAFLGNQSQEVVFQSGTGEVGIENQGLNHWGMNFVAAKPYEGYVWVRAPKSTTLFAALESQDGSQRYAEQSVEITAGDWQRVNVTLTPSASDKAGRFALFLKGPGAVTIGHVFLQPGEWGRYKGLPVRRDVAEGLKEQGITILRYGGSMVNSRRYQWKNMIGPRDRRQPYDGTWYRYSSNGWGIPDFLSFCDAAGFECVPAFNIDESPADMADFIDYAKAPIDTPWGAKRLADGHPDAFPLHYMELGNEERVDATYAQKFEALAAAIWAKDPRMILVVGDFAYGQTISDPFDFSGAASGIKTLEAHQRILRFAKAHDGEVWFDVHVNTDHPEPTNHSLLGMFSFTDALDKIAEGARHRVVVFEFNSSNHAMKRALANALAVNAIERDGRTPVVCVANGLQPDLQNDNGWDQGLLFLNPFQVWLQPPGYLTQMLTNNYEPHCVQCDVAAGDSSLDASATVSADGKTLVLKVVNPTTKPAETQLALHGFAPSTPTVAITELSGPLDAANPASAPDAVVPQKSRWPHALKDGRTHYLFPPLSVTVLRFE